MHKHDHDAQTIAGGLADFVLNGTMDKLLNNVISQRQEWVNRATDPRRNLNHECGYPDCITPKQYEGAYKRDGIARRVVRWLADACWSRPPQVYEEEQSVDKKQATPFEQDFADLPRYLRGKSWLKTDDNHPLFPVLKRAHIQSRVGRYAVIVVGLNDGADMSQPVEGVTELGSVPEEGMRREVSSTVNGKAEKGFVMEPPPAGKAVRREYVLNVAMKKRELRYLRVFPETQAVISRWEMNQNSPRFGQPTMYSISFAETDATGIGAPMSSMEVHWTRACHIAHTEGASEVFADPAMEASFNRLLDLQKLYGGSAEMVWRGGYHGIAIEGNPALAGELQFDEDSLKDVMEEYGEGLRRYLAFTNASARVLAPTAVDPTPFIDKQLEAIAIAEGVPKRLLTGSQAGALASSETDDKQGNDRVMEHQQSFLTFGLVGLVIDRLIWLGVLREPRDGYCVDWPDLNAASAGDKADIALKISQALAQWKTSGLGMDITFKDFMVRVLEWNDSVAEAVAKEGEKLAEEMALEAEADAQMAQTGEEYGV